MGQANYLRRNILPATSNAALVNTYQMSLVSCDKNIETLGNLEDKVLSKINLSEMKKKDYDKFQLFI